MKMFENPLEQAPVLEPVGDVRMTPAANDEKMFPRRIIDMEDGTQQLEERTPEALIARAEHQRDSYFAMIEIYEALKKMTDEDTVHGEEYRTERKMVAEGKMDELKLALPSEWEPRLEALIARALKIPLNTGSDYRVMRSEFERVIRKETIDADIARYAEEAVKAESSIDRYRQQLKERDTIPDYKGEDDGATTVFNEGNGPTF